MLRTSGDGCFDLGSTQVALYLVDDSREVFLPARGSFGDQPDDLVVNLGEQRAEGEVLELPLDRVHAEPMSKRGEDLQGLRGNTRLLVRPEIVQRPHVVQPIGKLDHQHPDVPAHRHDHLADRFGLGGLPVLDLVQLGAAVDEQRNLFAELVSQLGERVVRVFNRVVQ